MKTKKQIQIIYETLLSRAEDLAVKVSKTTQSRPYEGLVEEFNKLRLDYVLGFREMDIEEAKKSKYLLDSTDSYIRGQLDVIRVREMRESIRDSMRKSEK